MKKTIQLTILLAALMSMGSSKLYAYDIAVENDDGVTIYYNYSNYGKELEVVSGSPIYSGTVVIPEEVMYMHETRKVTSIGEKAFDHCSELTSVTIPNNVTTIGYGAFQYCYKLASVTIGDGVTTIGNAAFFHCFALTSVIIPCNVNSIGSKAFCDCYKLTSVIIPNSLTSIGGEAFRECSALTSIISLIENPFEIYGKSDYYKTFDSNIFSKATLYVPKGTIDKYMSTKGWKDFITIEEFGNQTPEVKQCAKPKIYYSNGKLSYKSETEGVTFQSTITDTDMGAYSSDEVDLTVTYHISVYATKSGYYQNSETAEATLCWIEVDPQKEGISEETPTDAKQLKALPVLIQAEDGQFSVEGAPEGTKVAVYDASGVELGAAVSRGGKTLVPARLPQGSIAIVKIGEKSVKVAVK
ncbi:MAG: leucine-rich repeat domain-containing protein [Prevotella sp.]|nr:leucine-rich repeat domain-containing protein [Prevotella sp.]